MAKKSSMNGAIPTTMPTGKDQHVNIGVRKISNGFVVSHSTSGPKGYQSVEHFHPKAPKIAVSGLAPVKGLAPIKAATTTRQRKAPNLAAKLAGVKI